MSVLSYPLSSFPLLLFKFLFFLPCFISFSLCFPFCFFLFSFYFLLASWISDPIVSLFHTNPSRYLASFNHFNIFYYLLSFTTNKIQENSEIIMTQAAAAAVTAPTTTTTNYTAGQFGDTTYTKVFVGGLAWETQKDTMKTYFEQFGEILEAVVITDKTTGRSKGYGFVTFREADAAMRACVDAAPVIDGRRANCNLASLGVQRSKPSTPNKLGGGRTIRVMGGYGGYHHHHNHNHHQAGAGGMGTTAFPSATAFPHYAIHQGIPFPATNLYGYSPYSPDYTYPTSYYNVYGGTNGQYPYYGASVGATNGGMITAAGAAAAAAAFYPYLNMAEGGHGNYATGQSYGVYPHHLYQYSSMNSSGGYAQQYGTPISLAATPALQPAVCFAVPQA